MSRKKITGIIFGGLCALAIIGSPSHSKPTPKPFTPPAAAVKHVGDDVSHAIKGTGKHVKANR
jgi:hypothetical protein